jgi:hypothetical protein
MNVGKVINYNEVTGKIITDKDIYTFSFYGIDKNIKNGDIVKFKICDDKNKIAIDVRPYLKTDLKVLMKVLDDELNNEN